MTQQVLNMNEEKRLVGVAANISQPLPWETATYAVSTNMSKNCFILS